MAFPNAEGQGRIEIVLCDPAKAAATSKLVDRFGVFSSLYDKIPTLIKQEVNSRTGNNISLVALRSTKSSFVVFIVKSAPDGYTHPVG